MTDTVGTPNSERIDQIIEKLHQLKEIRQQLVNEPISESGVWIHQYEVRKQYKQGFHPLFFSACEKTGTK